MNPCTTCRSPLPADARYCSNCGSEVTGHDTPTEALGWSPGPDAAAAGDVDRFPPGRVLAGRYRIVHRLGRGGMGDVFRADDLQLGQAVALKFLPARMAGDPEALRRLRHEVRLAREVAHPNVCRVFDIAGADGQHFITMEHVDGEDLATLIRRIGRLPHEKALEIGRQVCAGLAAAHDRGVLHRDLKPANVMVDGRGRARVMDFGLAGFEASVPGGEVGSGTPAYMAPEQFAGRGVTVRSDVYALGLLLHEIFTGRRVFDAETPAGLRRQRELGPRVSPSSVVRDMDPVVERVIQRCLEEDPALRPAGALQVAAALPGGDPLQAALAAGELPSPEVVAAASMDGALTRRAAALCAAGVALALIVTYATDRFSLHQRAPLTRSPAVLADRAASMLATLAPGTPPRHRSWGFLRDDAWLATRHDPLPPAERWGRVTAGQPITYAFWYRESPVPLAPGVSNFSGPARVTPDDPPQAVEGMRRIRLDPLGRLVEFHRVPAALDRSRPGADSVDWSPWFRAAGLDPAAFTPAAPTWTPTVHATTRAAWTGRHADHPDLPLRVEAAARDGVPVWFRTIGDWDQPDLAAPTADPPAQRAAAVLLAILILIVIVTTALAVRRNLREARSDRAGATRIAVGAFMLTFASRLLGGMQPPSLEGTAARFVDALAAALFAASALGLTYLALEPVLRRHRPERSVAWNRALAGRHTDPLVGRDTLVGVLAGSVCAMTWGLSGWVKAWTHSPWPPNHAVDMAAMGGYLPFLAQLLGQGVGSTWVGFALAIVVAQLRRVFKRDAIAGVVVWGLLVAMLALMVTRSGPALAFSLITTAILIGVTVRFGLLAGVVSIFVGELLMSVPYASDLARWYAPISLTTLALVGGLAAWGYRVSTRGRGGGSASLA